LYTGTVIVSNLSLINGTVAYKEAVKRIQENASDYNIQDSLFKDNADIDETIYNIMKYNYKIFEEKAKKKAKNERFEYPCKFFVIK